MVSFRDLQGNGAAPSSASEPSPFTALASAQINDGKQRLDKDPAMSEAGGGNRSSEVVV